MARLKCIAVDDEPLALMQLEKYIGLTEGVECVGTYYDAAEALAAVGGRDDIDFILLDINMPDMSGLEFVRSLPADHPLIVFTTAYQEYAVEGFKVEAVDYLTKPIGYEDFTASVERVRRRLPQRAATDDEAIYVRDSGSTRRIMLNDILMIKGLAEYVRIFLASSRPVTTLMSLRSLEERLPAGRFMRIHRSYIVNLAAIEGMGHNRVIIGGEELPVSESYRARLRDYIASRSI